MTLIYSHNVKLTNLIVKIVFICLVFQFIKHSVSLLSFNLQQRPARLQ